MSILQEYFEKFHEIIKLGTENKELRESRDAIKNRLNLSFEEYFQDTGIPRPSFFDQGSYAMGTGVKPHDNETYYDIDEGIKFPVMAANFPDPVDIKILVKQALENHTDLGVKIMGPCVRVIYSEQGEEKYHVDLAIYATNGQTQRGATLQLARGKEFSSEENRKWEDSQPEAVIDLVNGRFQDDAEMSQFKRNIKYLKRWKDVNFPTAGNSAPRGIALTIAAFNVFIPYIEADGSANDLQALINLTGFIISNVQTTFHDGEYAARYSCALPVKPYNDLFGKMTNKQMQYFLKKLSELRQALLEAQDEPDELKATLILAGIFGDDFPSPDLTKAFEQVKKPALGYFPTLNSIPGYDYAPDKMEIKGYIFVNGKKVPLTSNKKILRRDRYLEFIAKSNIDNADIYWRVVNTGNHVLQQANLSTNTIAETFRGKFEKGRVITVIQGKVEIIPSQNPLVTQEITAYTGKHWIECVAVKNGICVAKSKPFYVNIFNENFDVYD